MVTEDSQFAAALRARLADCLGQQRFELWFGSHARFAFVGNCLTVYATTAFTRDWLRRNFAEEVRSCAVAEFNRAVDVEFEVDEACDEASVDGVELESEADGRALEKSEWSVRPVEVSVEVTCDATHMASSCKKPKRAEPTFASFVVGKCNEYAFAAAELTARGSQQASPLLLCGGTSVGKTHLLRSLRAEFRRHQPTARAVYLTAEQFTTGFVEALHGSGLPSFRQKCRAADLLLIDDLQFFAGKRASLGELLHTLDAMVAAGKQVVLASDRSLAQLQTLGKELVSRLAGGLVCEMHLPDFATRREIVGRLSDSMGLAISQEVASIVATQISAGARELQGALHRLQAVSKAQRRAITPQLAMAELVELSQQCSRQVRLADVEHAVCHVFGVEPAQLRSDRKARSVNEPRMLAMWLARKFTRAPWSEIGQYFGRRSHSTVIAAHRRMEQLIQSQGAIGVSREMCGVEEAIRRVEAALQSA